MMCIIRICGKVGLKKKVSETLNRLRLRRKYSCVVLAKPTKEQLGMIKSMKDFIAYGEINKEIFEKLVEKRGKKDSKGNLKPFFRLHPPRRGIKTRFHFPKGVLGNNKEKINSLIERML